MKYKLAWWSSNRKEWIIADVMFNSVKASWRASFYEYNSYLVNNKEYLANKI